VAKTKELKKRSWGRRRKNHHVRFGKSRLARAALPFQRGTSDLELLLCPDSLSPSTLTAPASACPPQVVPLMHSMGLALLAVLSKENGITTVGILLLYELLDMALPTPDNSAEEEEEHEHSAPPLKGTLRSSHPSSLIPHPLA